MKFVYTVNSLIQLDFAASLISTRFRIPSLVCLFGRMGVGKTTLIKLLLPYLGQKESQVISPTYNLISIYNTDYFPIYHLDLYRLESAEELFSLGIEELLQKGLVFVEWPQILLKAMMIKEYYSIKFEKKYIFFATELLHSLD